MTTTTLEPHVNVESIPMDLRDVARWLVWRYETRRGKPTKVPYHPVRKRPMNVTDTKACAPFETALEALPEFDGLGFALGDGFAGIDLDDCFAEDGGPCQWARYILDDFAGTYAEVSPSSKGIKVFMHGRKPGGEVQAQATGRASRGVRWREVLHRHRPAARLRTERLA